MSKLDKIIILIIKQNELLIELNNVSIELRILAESP